MKLLGKKIFYQLFSLIFVYLYHMKQYEKAGNTYDRDSDKLVKC